MQPDLTELKGAQRAACRCRRAALGEGYRLEAGSGILRRLEAMPEYRASGLILAYASVGPEPDTRALIDRALASGKSVALPRCDTAAHTIGFYLIASSGELVPGCYGIPEPPDAARKADCAGGLLIVPALCC
ncbi:MAG: 5-formyltetrahydrofolate cyclo-ligase, partial [Clostridia bacterium]|nr:5-formyltetrahydrofolate cyclo-ligase [Clostridia bacterium]